MDKCLCVSGTTLVGLLALAIVLFCAYGYVAPVEVTIDEASLERLDLTAPAGNGTASLAYNLSLAVAVRNPNWVLRVWRTGPLDAELRLGGGPFGVVRLADVEEQDRIRAGKSKLYRVAASAESAPLGSDGVAAFARESAVGVFGLDLIVAGVFKYQVYGSESTTVRCPLRIPLSTSATAATFTAFEHTTLPQACVDAIAKKTTTN